MKSKCARDREKRETLYMDDRWIGSDAASRITRQVRLLYMYTYVYTCTRSKYSRLRRLRSLVRDIIRVSERVAKLFIAKREKLLTPTATRQ